MKKTIKIVVLVALLAVALVGCTRVPPGHVGIKVNLLGTDKGELQVYPTGRYPVGIHTEWHRFPTFRQNYVWTQNPAEGSPTDESFTFPVEGMVVGLDVGIEYSLEPDAVPEIFQTYRRGVEELTDVTIRNQVRDGFNELAGNYTMDDLVTGGIEDLMKDVEDRIRANFEPQGILIHSLSLVNAPRYPQSIVAAIEAKNAATQRAVQRENELREAQAQAQKDVAEAEGQARARIIQAEGEAEANRIRTESLTAQIIQMEWINKWDGSLPQVSSDAGGLMIDLRN